MGCAPSKASSGGAVGPHKGMPSPPLTLRVSRDVESDSPQNSVGSQRGRDGFVKSLLPVDSDLRPLTPSQQSNRGVILNSIQGGGRGLAV